MEHSDHGLDTVTNVGEVVSGPWEVLLPEGQVSEWSDNSLRGDFILPSIHPSYRPAELAATLSRLDSLRMPGKGSCGARFAATLRWRFGSRFAANVDWFLTATDTSDARMDNSR